MAKFLAHMIKKGYTQDEVFAVLFESEQEKKRRRMQAIVTETVNAHRLKKMKELLAYKKLSTWRSLRFELQKLKDAISMPAEDTVTRP